MFNELCKTNSRGYDISNFIRRDQKVVNWLFLRNDTKKLFLTNWGRDNNTQGNSAYFRKNLVFVD